VKCPACDEGLHEACSREFSGRFLGVNEHDEHEYEIVVCRCSCHEDEAVFSNPKPDPHPGPDVRDALKLDQETGTDG